METSNLDYSSARVQEKESETNRKIQRGIFVKFRIAWMGFINSEFITEELGSMVLKKVLIILRKISLDPKDYNRCPWVNAIFWGK